MGGSAPDISIAKRDEPIPDQNAKMEKMQTDTGTLEDGKQKNTLKKLWSFVGVNHILLFLIIFFEGFEWFGFNLDSWVLVSLITGVMGSTTVYFLRKSTDFAYSR